VSAQVFDLDAYRKQREVEDQELEDDGDDAA
jgi:hypothetical protein